VSVTGEKSSYEADTVSNGSGVATATSSSTVDLTSSQCGAEATGTAAIRKAGRSANGERRGSQRRARGQPVVHDHDGAASNVDERSARTVASNAALEHCAFTRGDLRDDTRRDAEIPAHGVIDDRTSALGDRAKGDFAHTRDTELPNTQHVERSA
jgi:hypothetical protein